MKTINTLGKFIIIITSVALLSACATPALYSDTQGKVDQVTNKIEQAHIDATDQAKATPAVLIKDSMYVDITPISLSKQPLWLKQQITLNGEKLPFSFYSRNIVQSANVLTKYQTQLDYDIPVNINYTGTLQGALDVLAAKTGYTYTIDNDTIYWKAFVTKTFNIAFMPGSANYLVGKEKGSDKGSKQESNDDTIIKEGSDAGSKNQYSNLSATLSVWNDMQKTISTLLSQNGTVVVSESTTSITVTDRPSNVDNIAHYIEQINADLSKQVMIKVQVLQINLQKSFSNGINWNLAKTMLHGTNFTFSGDFAAPIAITPIAGLTSASLGISSGSSDALINALSQQGQVSTTTEPTMVTTNNQVASLNITTQTGYLAKLAETTSSDSTNTTTSSLTPGQVNTGLSLFMLPKIMGDKVYLQISSSLSTLNQIQDLYSKGVNSASNTSNKIQAPIITDNSFNQRSVIKSGATLILAGFKQLQNEANGSAYAQIEALGGKGAQQKNVQTIILITPYILEND